MKKKQKNSRLERVIYAVVNDRQCAALNNWSRNYGVKTTRRGSCEELDTSENNVVLAIVVNREEIDEPSWKHYLDLLQVKPVAEPSLHILYDSIKDWEYPDQDKVQFRQFDGRDTEGFKFRMLGYVLAEEKYLLDAADGLEHLWEPDWIRTVYVDSDDSGLVAALEQLSGPLDFDIIGCDDGDIDGRTMVTSPCFAMVMDRERISNEAWSWFRETRWEKFDPLEYQSSFILLDTEDGIEGQPLNINHVSRDRPDREQFICDRIAAAKELVDKTYWPRERDRAHRKGFFVHWGAIHP